MFTRGVFQPVILLKINAVFNGHSGLHTVTIGTMLNNNQLKDAALFKTLNTALRQVTIGSTFIFVQVMDTGDNNNSSFRPRGSKAASQSLLIEVECYLHLLLLLYLIDNKKNKEVSVDYD